MSVVRFIRKICATKGCDTMVASRRHRYCDRCGRIRARQSTNVSHRRQKNPGQLAALKEQRVIKEISKPRPRKVQAPIMTDMEQLAIEKEIANRASSTDITDPRVRRITQPCAWLWGHR